MEERAGKWMYNVGSEEHWDCPEGEFDTREEAVAAGIEFFTLPDGYEDYRGEKFEGESFDVGIITNPDVSIDAWRMIDDVIEQVGEQCGDVSESWLSHVKYEDRDLLSEMLTSAFKIWLRDTNNEPHFYAISNIETIKLNDRTQISIDK